MTKVDNGVAATYTYVGAQRVKKVSGSTTTVYIFSGSKVVAEYVNGALSREYVYSGTSLLATVAAGGATTYHHPDHLSTRVETDGTGVVTRTFGQYPFGEVWYETGTANKWKFTSYERDSESGLDYAGFRYDSSRLGRFMSPDPLAGSLSNPQSLNRYAYVANDPVNRVDPLGLKSFPYFRGDVEYEGFRGGGGGGWGSGLIPDIFIWNCPVNDETGQSLGCSLEEVIDLPEPSIAPERRGGGGGRRGATKGEKKDQRECFAQLKTRPVNDPAASAFGGTHSFWYVQGSTGTQYIVSAGPNPPNGGNQTLNVWKPNTDINGGADNVSAHTTYDSGLSSKNCKGVDALLAAANAFPNNSIPYSWFWGPNSNSAANYLGQQGGVNPSAPLGSWGWSVPIPPPQPK